MSVVRGPDQEVLGCCDNAFQPQVEKDIRKQILMVGSEVQLSQSNSVQKQASYSLRSVEHVFSVIGWFFVAE